MVFTYGAILICVAIIAWYVLTYNALVKARSYAADQLFATLDTTTRQLYLGEAGRTVSLSDTVGFIRDLPHGLVEAFAATLQEAAEADLLLHVVDASNPDHPEQIAAVERVLGEIGAADVPQLLVFNKVDALDPARMPHQRLDTIEVGGRALPRLFVSAHEGTGLPELRAWLAAEVARRSAGAATQDPQEALESGNPPA